MAVAKKKSPFPQRDHPATENGPPPSMVIFIDNRAARLVAIEDFDLLNPRCFNGSFDVNKVGFIGASLFL